MNSLKDWVDEKTAPNLAGRTGDRLMASSITASCRQARGMIHSGSCMADSARSPRTSSEGTELKTAAIPSVSNVETGLRPSTPTAAIWPSASACAKQ